MNRAANIWRSLAAFLVLFAASVFVHAGEVFEYRRLADLDVDLKAQADEISYLKSAAISAYIVGINFEELLHSDELIEVILPGGKTSYWKTKEVIKHETSLSWLIYMLPDTRMFDDYDIPEDIKKTLNLSIYESLHVSYQGDYFVGGKPYGIASSMEALEEALATKEEFNITRVAGDFTVFLRGDRYRLIPLDGPGNDHLLIELDVSKLRKESCGVLVPEQGVNID